MPPYKIPRQCRLVIACYVVHNIIRELDVNDQLFSLFEDENANVSDMLDESSSTGEPAITELNFGPDEIREWGEFRDAIAMGLWNAHAG